MVEYFLLRLSHARLETQLQNQINTHTDQSGKLSLMLSRSQQQVNINGIIFNSLRLIAPINSNIFLIHVTPGNSFNFFLNKLKNK